MFFSSFCNNYHPQDRLFVWLVSFLAKAALSHPNNRQNISLVSQSGDRINSRARRERVKRPQ